MTADFRKRLLAALNEAEPMTAREIQGRRNEGAVMHELYKQGFVIEFTEPGQIVLRYFSPSTSLPGHEKPRSWFDEAARRGFSDELP